MYLVKYYIPFMFTPISSRCDVIKLALLTLYVIIDDNFILFRHFMAFAHHKSLVILFGIIKNLWSFK